MSGQDVEVQVCGGWKKAFNFSTIRGVNEYSAPVCVLFGTFTTSTHLGSILFVIYTKEIISQKFILFLCTGSLQAGNSVWGQLNTPKLTRLCRSDKYLPSNWIQLNSKGHTDLPLPTQHSWTHKVTPIQYGIITLPQQLNIHTNPKYHWCGRKIWFLVFVIFPLHPGHSSRLQMFGKISYTIPLII